MCCAFYKPCGCNFREWSCKGVVRRGVKCVAIDTGDLVSTKVNYQTSYYKGVTSLKYIK